MAIGADLAVNIAASLIYDTTKFGLGTIQRAGQRRGAINRELNPGGQQASAGKSDPALTDLIRVLAHDHGAFDENIALFLGEVQRSGIPLIMREHAACGADSDPAFYPFDLIYRRYKGLPFESRTLFNAIFAAIRSRYEQETHDPALLKAVQEQHKVTRRYLESIQQSLLNARDVQNAIDHAAFSSARRRWAESIEQSNIKINVETNEGQKRVDIERFAIPTRLRPTNPRAPDTPTVRDPGSAAISYVDFRRTVRNCVILGDPGGGKSTLTQLLCYSMAKQVRLESTAPLERSFNPQDLRLPLKVILRTLEIRQKKVPFYSAFDYLRDDARDCLGIDDRFAEEIVRQVLMTGQAFVLFDGLDEILDVSDRRDIASHIEQFSHSFAACPVLVTSRVVGYRDAPLNNRFGAFVLSRFNTEEVSKFSTNLIREVAGHSEEEARALAVRFVTQTEGIAADLRQNPLLLGLMAYLFIYKGDVPDNRPEIYKECSILMFQKWDKNRGIAVKMRSDFKLLDLFGFLAKRIFGDASLEEGVTSEWLRFNVNEFFTVWYSDPPKAVEATEILTEFLVGRAWVMCEAGPGVFKFTHRTFLEYFFARRLEAESENVVELVDRVLFPKIVRAEWDVVSHLAIQIATYENSPRTLKAADALLRALRQSKSLSDSERANLLVFTARSLEYLNVPESKLQEISKEITEFSIRLGADVGVAAVIPVQQLLYFTEKRAEVVQPCVKRPCIETLAGDENARRDFTVYMIGQKDYVDEDRAAFRANPLAYSPSYVWPVFAKERAEVHADQESRAKRSVKEARHYVYLYGKGFSQGYWTHGSEFLIPEHSPRAPVDLNRLPFICLQRAMEAVRGDAKKEDLYSSDDCLLAITSAAEDLLAGKFAPLARRPRTQEAITNSAEELDHLLRNIYDLAGPNFLAGRVGRGPAEGPTNDADLVGACLAVFAFMMEFSRGVRSRPSRAVGMRLLTQIAPEDAMDSMFESVSGTRFGPMLHDWLKGERQFCTFASARDPASNRRVVV